jgi:hypothetical protein
MSQVPVVHVSSGLRVRREAEWQSCPLALLFHAPRLDTSDGSTTPSQGAAGAANRSPPLLRVTRHSPLPSRVTITGSNDDHRLALESA